nr:MAG TPA: hypothetical protein [Caudoviricetes sp.]
MITTLLCLVVTLIGLLSESDDFYKKAILFLLFICAVR